MDGHTFRPLMNRTHPKMDLTLVNMSLFNLLTLRRPDRQMQETYRVEGLVQGLATMTPCIGSTLLRRTLAATMALLTPQSFAILWLQATNTTRPPG
jgi:hypothetical protein